MLVTLVAQTFGLLIGATVMDAKTAQTVTAVVMLTMMLVRTCRMPHHACACKVCAQQRQKQDVFCARHV